MGAAQTTSIQGKGVPSMMMAFLSEADLEKYLPIAMNSSSRSSINWLIGLCTWRSRYYVYALAGLLERSVSA